MKHHAQRLWIRLTANPRQFWMLCAGVAVGLLLWARLIIVSSMPRTAIAEEGQTAGATSESTHGDARSENTIAPAVSIQFADGPIRDPFEIDPRFFPRPTQLDKLTGEVEKSDTQEAEDSSAAEAKLLARLQTLVDAMQLDAAMPDAGMVMINSGMYRSGDIVTTSGENGLNFTIKSIRQRSATLECEGRLFVLEMETPGG